MLNNNNDLPELATIPEEEKPFDNILKQFFSLPNTKEKTSQPVNQMNYNRVENNEVEGERHFNTQTNNHSIEKIEFDANINKLMNKIKLMKLQNAKSLSDVDINDEQKNGHQISKPYTSSNRPIKRQNKNIT